MTLITEAEAKTKWCPHARTAVGEDLGDGKGLQIIAANRAEDYSRPHHCLCLGSGCMAWRWEGYRKPADRETAGRGFCGAFGIPMESIV